MNQFTVLESHNQLSPMQKADACVTKSLCLSLFKTLFLLGQNQTFWKSYVTAIRSLFFLFLWILFESFCLINPNYHNCLISHHYTNGT